ncbi:tyrosine-type recombinase/integrase [Brevibacillus composti]|uniref:Tyrosine-type recombinase/integrase n=1 Tax=Brevibacillus composti TaxID=2796470 RepID=A0A7T5EKB0_9BACL|nr:tyrosine-type recombinase/integrase [Brevibacillus composti]QQE74133.1 tyrosine-type recombinase/integrase [Brevibacillus composti]QUO41217.1 tyrosine-type recombinase/integrase [Brevibacillus composti]
MDVIQQFEEYLVENGIAPKTIESYVGDVRAFCAFLREMGVDQPTDLKRFYVSSYKSRLTDSKYAVATINKKINSLQAFNLFLIERKLTTEQVVTLRKDRIKVAAGSEGEVEVFSEQEVNQLLFFVQDRTKVTLRNHLIVWLLLYTGVRVSELCGIRLGDIDYLTNTLRVTGKGGKYREIPLRPDLVDLIKEYVRTERQQSKHRESPFLLVSQRAEKMHKDAVNTMLEGLEKRLGFRIYPHKFRHTFCTRLLQKNVPLTTVSKLAGHAHIQTTAHFYINTSKEEKERAVNLL